MNDLYIVGASGFGRELLQWIKDINRVEETWNVVGFLDDNLNALDGYDCEYRVVGTICSHHCADNEVFAIAIANPKVKERVVTLLRSSGARFISVIHPRAIICDHSKIGDGVVVYPNASVGPNVCIGNFVTLLGSGIGHDSTVGDFTTISSYCDITGGSKIGRRVFLASRVTLVPGTLVGDDAYIGAGSVVLRNVAVGSRMFGYPAKKMEF